MKEFIEKLIGRLGEQQAEAENEMHRLRSGDYTLPCSYDITDIKEIASESFKESIQIVNQLAEEYKGGWIPCSERLPENTDLEYFLVWCKGYFTEGTHIGEECQWYGIGLLYNKNKWKVYQCKDIKDIEVIAWQPLPAPYKKGCE